MSHRSLQTAFKVILEAGGISPDLPLRDFDSLFPTIAVADQFYFAFNDPSLPKLAGEYRVVDLYCQDSTCHCHKVSLGFLGRDKKTYATVSYGWKSQTFYRKWGLDAKMSQALAQGFLDPCAPQSEHASHFLKIFLRFLKRDPKFVARLKSRYALFKKTLEDNPSLILDFPKDQSHRLEPANNVIPFKRS